MKRPNITPGEWTQNADTVWRSTRGKTHPVVVQPNHSAQSIADARAIAALPDLLEALERSLAGLESDVLYCERHPDPHQTTHEGMLAHKRQRLANAKAALVKAGYVL